MPYKREGKCVYVKEGGSWEKKGCSDSAEEAEAYKRKLYSVEEMVREEVKKFMDEKKET